MNTTARSKQNNTITSSGPKARGKTIMHLRLTESLLRELLGTYYVKALKTRHRITIAIMPATIRFARPNDFTCPLLG